MAKYEIVETPGQRVVDLNDEDLELSDALRSPSNQDEAQMVIARLRAIARAEGNKFDYLFKRINEPRANGGGSSNGATSIRLTEEVRSKVARITGKIMYDTGTTPSMGEVVSLLADHYMKTIDLDLQQLKDDAVNELLASDNTDEEDLIIGAARRITKARKAAANA